VVAVSSLGEAVETRTLVSDALWNSFVDPSQVENAVLNLAINARDAMPDGGRLTVEAVNATIDDAYVRGYPEATPGEYVMIAVSDTGTGIAPEILGRVFEPFFSTKDETRGTGLGLSMVYGFVRQSGGHVRIDSEPGHGTTVRLYLPREHAPEAVAREAMSHGASIGGAETILVAEDDGGVRDIVVGTLEELGYHVLMAGDASAALGLIESGRKIDLLFTDVVMPGPLKSPELAQIIKRRFPGTAVLFTSGYTENSTAAGGRLDPDVDLLPKPYTRDDLAEKIRHVLGRHAASTSQEQVAV